MVEKQIVDTEALSSINAEPINVADIQATTAEPVLEVVSDVENKTKDSKDDAVVASEAEKGQNNAIQKASAPPESNNVLSDYISNDLINKNMFNITEIKNALLNALKIEFGKLLTMKLSKKQADTLRSNVEKLKYRELFKLNEKFTLPPNPTLKDEFVVHMLSTEMKRLSDIKLWKSHLMIDLAGKLLKNIDFITPIEKRVVNVKSK